MGREEIESKREQAYAEAGWVDGRRDWPKPGRYEDEIKLERDRAYADGVEAALLWVLGDAGDPFPR